MKTGVTAFVALLLCLPVHPATADTPPDTLSTGFTNPADPARFGLLLDYRLPDWGYRTTTLRLFSNGSGLDAGREESGSAYANESIVHERVRESESRTWSYFANQSVFWSWSEHLGWGGTVRRHDLQAVANLGGKWRQYVTDRAALVGSTSMRGTYTESRPGSDPRPPLQVNRTLTSTTRLGAGLGRLRDVTPLLRALRISERLQALGREPLSAEATQHVARVLAQSEGYNEVYDRSGRRFWRDVLAPLAGGGAPLAPYEINYLQEVSGEVLESRNEGYTADVGLQFQTEARVDRLARVGFGPWLAGAWSHNLGLDHQVSLEFDSSYLTYQRHSESPYAYPQHQGQAALTARYLWVVADRISLQNSLGGATLYQRLPGPGFVLRDQSVTWTGACFFRIEDQVTLTPQVSGTWRRSFYGLGAPEDSRAWQYQLGLTYRLGGNLL